MGGIQKLILAAATAMMTTAAVVTSDATGSRSNDNDISLPIPAFVWSPMDGVVAGKNNYVGLEANGIAQSDLTNMVAKMCGDDQIQVNKKLANALGSDSMDKKGQQAPKVALVFMADKMSSNELNGGFSALKTLVEGEAQSSVVVPYTYLDSKPGVQTPWSQWFDKQENKLFFNAVKDDIATFEKEIEQSQQQGKLTILVALGDAPTWDQNIEQISSIVNKISGGNYLGVFTALNHEKIASYPIELEMVNHVDTSLAGRRVLAHNGTEPFAGHTPITFGTRSTPGLIFGLIFALAMVFTLFIFLFCMDYVQAPSKFASKNPPMGKVFD